VEDIITVGSFVLYAVCAIAKRCNNTRTAGIDIFYAVRAEVK
jgi:hypothetical protein